MSLLFAEHTATVYPRSESADPVTKVVPIPAEAAGVSLTCQIQPIRSGTVFDARTGDELLNPHSMLVEPEDIASVPYGARVVWEDTEQQFRITKKPQSFLANGDLSSLNYGEAEMELLEKAS